ncbi:hypothetical protein [Pontixanthobacter sp.]|uniref:hypothetical protein n=1 Tax=Pontixanthobacter sp. TaxID=2792078 RepID=UPI003C7AF1D7
MGLGIALSVIMLSQAATHGAGANVAADTGEFMSSREFIAAGEASISPTQTDIDTHIDMAIGQDDPAALITLGVEFARSGQTGAALQVLNAAVQSETRYRLETANGNWVDSRRLALKVIGMIDNGEFAAQERLARR